MIVVTGGNGTYGRGVIEALLRRVPADQLGVSVRDTAKAAELADRGVRVRPGSFDDPASLAHSFENADQVLVVSTDIMGPSGVAASRAAVEAAVRAGASRVVYTSHMGCSHDSAFQACVDHAQVEDTLAGCGTAWTSLRNGFYASSALQFAAGGIAAGEVAVPADGAANWTAHADLVDAAAALLTGNDPVEGPTPPLIAGQAASFDDIARTAAETTGRPVSRRVVADEDFVGGLTANGVPEPVARQLLGMFVAARRGEFAAEDPTLARLTGRTPVTMADTVRASLAADGR